ncbi:hypothetical protein GBAR_LOCUS5195 [Geodia barretti]|uniref:Death domain-containing protein n=1 Tax=Geodia barretti TaxID=519541 RepID=A0AA35WBS3_GEOBA|nr:hypothetical protein GBAR_LOCUS5195 [Geodia barretti]
MKKSLKKSKLASLTLLNIYQDESKSGIDESRNLHRKRPLSASAIKSKSKKPQNEKSEITTCTTLARNPHQGIPQQTLSDKSASDSAESVYKTPPTSRRPSASIHPLIKVTRVGTTATAPSPTSTLPHSLKSVASPLSYMSLLPNQHEILKAVKDLSEKLDEVQSQPNCRNPGGSLLPQNVPVSPSVILELSKHVAKPQWKFLARRLYLPDHDIDQIEANHRENIQEQSYQKLLKWIQSSGGGSYQELGEALRKQFGQQLYSDFVKIVRESEEQ